MPSQQRRRPTGRRRRSSVAARRRARPVYMRLGFWLTACALVIVVVLLTKGFDRGRIETGGLPTCRAVCLPADNRAIPSGIQITKRQGPPANAAGNRGDDPADTADAVGIVGQPNSGGAH